MTKLQLTLQATIISIRSFNNQSLIQLMIGDPKSNLHSTHSLKHALIPVKTSSYKGKTNDHVTIHAQCDLHQLHSPKLWLINQITSAH